MRAKILGLLRERVQEPVSGEEISAKLGVSRTAVWKHIQSLKNVGYDIESVPKKGYILHKSPDLLSPEEIVAHLETKWVGHHIHYLKEASSSNEVGKRLADQGCADGLVVVAEEQTRGKGRLSRGWFSPMGCGVWCSVVFRPPFMPSEASKCTLLAAVAVIKAINKYKGVNAKIKWPNDVLLEGKKLAISVADVAREPIQRVQILADYLKNMEDLYETVLREGFGPVLDEWRTYSDTIGQAVKVIAPDKTYFGTAVDIDKEGLLIVKKEDGTMEKVIAGDVSIRPAAAKGKRYS